VPFPASVVFKSFTLFRTFPLLTLLAGPWQPRVETIRLTGAVKNIWARRAIAGFA
jgi:hypothetical protein